ncbi:efflux RND transporter periplasmic adaptor subunit [Terracidiphilus gabretensis]|uniref:efflux RND transporter periplasmic adaptor subunit n=1 Tax=Terracidiphilus gabretensis TaxID=1577687 RepID=UPI0012FA9278|nr:efflux RND transporter periplasmic adaptor subunit [Terracidiphilus gabretensis]
MRGKRILVYALCVAAAVVVIALILHRSRSPKDIAEEHTAHAVSVVAAVRGPIARQLVLAGIFQPFQEIDVHGKVSGYVQHIYVDIGDRVHQGQTLAILEVPELDAQVEGAQAGVARSQDEIARMQREVSRDEAIYAAAHANYERLKQASDQQPGLIAAQELDDALAKDRSAAAQVDAAKSAVSAAQGQLGVAKADKMRVSSMVQYATISAPFTGVVTMRYADTGSLVPAGTSESNAQAVVRLAQSDVLRLRMPVPEEDVPFVHEGSQVMVRIQATGARFPGKVVRFTRDVSTATRTMLTEVDVPNPSLTLAPGMYAEVAFNLEQKSDAVIVPTAAIVQGDQPSVLLVNASNLVERRAVSLGISGANRQEILSGIAPGDQVIVGGLASVRPGDRVQPRPVSADMVEYHDTDAKEAK